MIKFENLLKDIKPYLGPRQIEVSSNDNWQNFSGKIDLFVFNYFEMDESSRIDLLDVSSDNFNVDLTSWEWEVNDEEEVLGGMCEFWMSWEIDGLAPFSFIGGESRGPFTPCDAILLFDARNAKEINEMPILLFSGETNTLTKVANSFSELSFIDALTDRESSLKLKEEGMALAGEGKNEEAIDKFYEALKFDPSHGMVYNNIATMLYGQIQTLGDLRQPGILYQLSYQIDETCSFGLMGHASVLNKMNRPDKSIDLTKQAISVEKDDLNKAGMYFYLATYHQQLENDNEMKKACEMGKMLNPEDTRFEELLANHS